ncbi:hypothetical protein COV19_00320 [Candidatus Woesearchaeota archaeon CG10_big_fil_rev_8_21_14_0_10_44_13]|nr:MAG: hypothetical protein COV19_00320 [Candidatus Woesearchaeota archaeon CG10_big_fil_rev_8_21_14_0_10_44_13]
MGISLSAILFFVLCAVFSSAAERADYVDRSGKQISGREGQTYTVDFSDKSYVVKISSIEGDYVTVYVDGEGPKTIREQETALFARTKEGTAMSIEVIGVSGNYTNLRMRMVAGIKPAEPVVESPAYIVEDKVQAEASQTQAGTAQQSYSASDKMITGVLIAVASVLMVFFVRHLMRKKARTKPSRIIIKKAKRGR